MFGGEFEDLRVGEPAERGVGGEAEHVVAPLFECAAEPLGGEVGVEEKPQAQASMTSMTSMTSMMG